MTIESKENKKPTKRCGECVLFGTHKCTYRYHRVPIRNEPPKVINSWEEWLEWLYDFSYLDKPVEAYKLELFPIYKTDVACSDFIPFG